MSTCQALQITAPAAFAATVLPLVDGGALQLQCGGQGVFMFEVYPVFGGFTPTDDYVEFQVVLDIDGHNEGPTGHFYGESTHNILVGCIDDYY